MRYHSPLLTLGLPDISSKGKPRKCSKTSRTTNSVSSQSTELVYSLHKYLSPISADELRPSAHEIITRVRAIAPSTSTKPHSLSFNEGDMIEVLDNRERFRWKGRFEDSTGYFSPHCVVSKLSILVPW